MEEKKGKYSLWRSKDPGAVLVRIILYVFVGIPFLCILGLVVCWLISLGNGSKESAETTMPISLTRQSSTANWANFSDALNGFSFKYPQAWQKEPLTVIEGMQSAYDFFPQPPANATRLETIVYNDPIDKEKANIEQNDRNIQIFHNFSSTMVGSKPAYISEIITIEGNQYQTVLIDLGNNQTLYLDAEGSPVQKLNEILATFTFAK